MSRGDLGRAGEAAAWDHLRRCGYTLLERNLRTRFGEIDLVVARDGVVAFVEVRGRSGSRFGGPFESVDRRKQQKIARVASQYLARKHLGERSVRFDVVAIEWQDGRPTVDHLENAFEVPD